MARYVLVMLLMAALLTGCLNVSEHIDHGRRYRPYDATVSVSRGIAEAFVVRPEWHAGSVSEARMSNAFAVLLLPLSIVALPFEAVADTFTLPYDAFQWRSSK